MSDDLAELIKNLDKARHQLTPEDMEARRESQISVRLAPAPADSFPRDENELKNLLIWLYRFSQSPRLERALDEKPAGRRIKEIVSGR